MSVLWKGRVVLIAMGRNMNREERKVERSLIVSMWGRPLLF